MKPTTSIRKLAEQAAPVISIGAHDALAARMIELQGFQSISVGGSMNLASRYALPDIGIAALGEMQSILRDITNAVKLPCISDADDGYGDLASICRTVRTYETLGVSALVLEDQQRAAKKPGDAAASILSDAEDMSRKIRCAVESREDPETLIIARTDSIALEGLDGALRRAQRYLKAGADGIFVPGMTSEHQMQTVGRELQGTHLMIVQIEGGQTPWISPAELGALGYRHVAYPTYLMMRSVNAMADGLDAIKTVINDGFTPGDKDTVRKFRRTLDAAVDLDGWQTLARSGTA